MPLTKTDYSKGLIYKLVCLDKNITDCYVGSTTNIVCRKSKHKNICNTETHPKHQNKVYKFIRDHGGWENWALVLIEYFSCKDNNELRARELYHYELFNTTLNTRTPFATKEHIIQRNIQYSKQYRNDNKEKLLKYNEEYKNGKKNIIQ